MGGLEVKNGTDPFSSFPLWSTTVTPLFVNITWINLAIKGLPSSDQSTSSSWLRFKVARCGLYFNSVAPWSICLTTNEQPQPLKRLSRQPKGLEAPVAWMPICGNGKILQFSSGSPWYPPGYPVQKPQACSWLAVVSIPKIQTSNAFIAILLP